MRYLSVCSGIEAASVAFRNFGWEPVGFSEIEEFPSSVLKHHFPDVPNFGDMTKFKEWKIEPGSVDMMVGGTPCFDGETLILTKKGFIPIKNIAVGDYVLTHKNRWKKVLKAGSKYSETIILKGQGQSNGIITTRNHPFYSRKKLRKWNNEIRRYDVYPSSTEWINANDMLGKYWAIPTKYEPCDIPTIKNHGREKNAPELTKEIAYLCGRYLGDGWARINNRRGVVIICCGKHKREHFKKKMDSLGLNYCEVEERTVFKFHIPNKSLARWILQEFGSGAHHKTIPSWVFSWEHKESLFNGYLESDGFKTTNGYGFNTVSKKLALGIMLLSASLGYSVSRSLTIPKRKKCVIEGRDVNESPFWTIKAYNKARSSFEVDGCRYGLVRKVEPHKKIEVFNLEVEEDNSYVADGLIVHNCQSFSVAGLRRGLKDPRGNLMLTYGAIAAHLQPRILIWENVPGVLSSNGGRDFGTFLGMLAELGYGFAYRILDAQFVRVESHRRAVPQRRRRVFVVGYLGDWRRAAEVLFESESLCRYTPPSRKTGERTSSGAKTSIDQCCESGIAPCAPSVTVSPPFSRTGNERVEAEAMIPVSYALNAKGGTGRIDAESETFVPTIGYHTTGDGFWKESEEAGTLRAREQDSHENVVAFAQNSRNEVREMEVSGALSAEPGMKQTSYLRNGLSVRRLTPLECERLMGFPDGYTKISWKGKDPENCPDGPRYKALGNSMAVNCMYFIGSRIDKIEKSP